MEPLTHLDCWFDGACWPNPNGHAASGALIKLNGQVIFEGARYIGNQNTSNNVAEYDGLNQILEYLIENPCGSALIYGDADLVIKQMKGKWKAGALSKKERKGKVPIKPRYYLPFYYKASYLLSQIEARVDFIWISRDLNTEADALSTKPLIERGLRDPKSGLWKSYRDL